MLDIYKANNYNTIYTCLQLRGRLICKVFQLYLSVLYVTLEEDVAISARVQDYNNVIVLQVKINYKLWFI